jgi:hypothetical protein
MVLTLELSRTAQKALNKHPGIAVKEYGPPGRIFIIESTIFRNMASKADDTIKRSDLPEEDSPSLMRASQRTLAPLIEKEANIYSVADLKIRFR